MITPLLSALPSLPAALMPRALSQWILWFPERLLNHLGSEDQHLCNFPTYRSLTLVLFWLPEPVLTIQNNLVGKWHPQSRPQNKRGADSNQTGQGWFTERKTGLGASPSATHGNGSGSCQWHLRGPGLGEEKQHRVPPSLQSHRFCLSCTQFAEVWFFLTLQKFAPSLPSLLKHSRIFRSI